MTRLADRSGGYVYYTYLALRYDLMGIIPWKGIPLGLVSRLMVRSTVRLVLPCVLFTIRLMEA